MRGEKKMVTRYRPEVKEKGRWKRLAGRISFGNKELARKTLKKFVKARREAGIKVQKSRVKPFRIKV